MTDDLLPIPEAAARLGVTEARLRRLLARPEYSPRVVSLTRETRTGTRTCKAIPLPFLFELQAVLERKTTSGNPRERERERNHKHVREVFPGAQTALVTRLLQEQEARIADLRAQVANLQAQLEAANARQAALMAALARALPAAEETEATPRPRRRWWWFRRRQS